MTAQNTAGIDTPCETRRYAEIERNIPVTEAGVVQLGRGDLCFRLFHAFGRDIHMMRMRVAPELSGYVVPNPDWLAVMVPLSWRGDYVFNGAVARSGSVFLSTGRDGYSTSGRNRDTISIGIRKSEFNRICARLTGMEPEDSRLTNLMVDLGPWGTGRIRAYLLAALEQVSRVSAHKGFGPLRREVEETIKWTLARLTVGSLGEEPTPHGCAWEALGIVRRAEQVVQRCSYPPPTLAQLCDAVGVGQTRLHECFREIYRTSPSRHLKLLRLSRAHERLMDPEATEQLVKQVALDLGFSNSGRFGAAYREMFGEFPSETLSRRTQAMS